MRVVASLALLAVLCSASPALSQTTPGPFGDVTYHVALHYVTAGSGGPCPRRGVSGEGQATGPDRIQRVRRHADRLEPVREADLLAPEDLGGDLLQDEPDPDGADHRSEHGPSCLRAWEAVEGLPHAFVRDRSGTTDGNVLRNAGIPTARFGLPGLMNPEAGWPPSFDACRVEAMQRLTRAYVHAIVDTCTRRREEIVA